MAWGMHRIADVFAGPGTQCITSDGRVVVAVCEPYQVSRWRAAWWAFTRRTTPFVWPEPGELERAIGGARPATRNAAKPDDQVDI